MSRAGREEELRALVGQSLKCDPASLRVGADLVGELGLDSMTSLRLLATIEKRFGVRFPDERLSEFRNLEAILELIEEQQGRSS